jgi:deazaflavin-dependent oxidoreductase (nitroreductase family)
LLNELAYVVANGFAHHLSGSQTNHRAQTQEKREHFMARTLQLNLADRIGDALFMALLRAGVKIGTMSLLTVRGRTSGQPHTVPVLLVEQKGERFLVAPYGVVQWVRNIRAAGTATLTLGRRSESISVIELAAQEAAPVLKQYLEKAPAARPYFDATKDSPLEAFEREATRHPVFQIAKAGGPTKQENSIKEAE